MSKVQRTLDWKPNLDERSLPFRFALQDCWANGAFRHSIMRRKTTWIDQGIEGACTGFGEENVRALSPKPKLVTNETARTVYREAQRRDEWPGEDYEGSSVNGAMKAARFFGFIKEWHWCLNLRELDHALSYHGAVEMGSNWYDGMFDTDGDGFVHPTGSIAGGHAFAVAGYGWLNGGKRYRIENSWGSDWGDVGGCWIWSADMEQLIGETAELACPVKV